MAGSPESQAGRGCAGHRCWGVFVFALVIGLCLAPPVHSATPQGHLQATFGAVTAVLEDPALQGADKDTERRQRVRQIIIESFDFTEMAKESLGGHWGKFTAAQREEFTALFGSLFERSYNRLVLRFLGDRSTIYGGESIEAERAIVPTTLVSKQDAQLPIDYRLLRHGERWAIYDVVIEGISLVANYRAQFSKILRTSSYETLVQRIKAKLEEEPL